MISASQKARPPCHRAISYRPVGYHAHHSQHDCLSYVFPFSLVSSILIHGINNDVDTTLTYPWGKISTNNIIWQRCLATSANWQGYNTMLPNKVARQKWQTASRRDQTTLPNKFTRQCNQKSLPNDVTRHSYQATLPYNVTKQRYVTRQHWFDTKQCCQTTWLDEKECSKIIKQPLYTSISIRE